MSSRRLPALLLVFLVLVGATPAFGFETDQYDLPPEPLADIGDEVSAHVEARLRKALEKINTEIARRQRCVKEESRAGCDSVSIERAKLEYLRSEDGIARAVFDQLGAGTPPFTSMGTWMDSHHFQNQPARYRTSYAKSIFLPIPYIALTISATVNMYGAEFGTDKIAHLFQQGYSYYKIYRSALAAGSSRGQATMKAVRWGQKTEHTYFGTLVAGVYSNGDLAANYVGLKFYQGLANPIEIEGSIRPATFSLKDGFWSFNEGVSRRDRLLRPFISDHLNEALNPSIFTKHFGLRWFIRRAVKRRSCAQWFDRFPELTQSGIEEKARALRLWRGEDYGFTHSEHFITIANTCFEAESPRIGRQ